MRMIIKPLWLALATLSALLTVVSCVKELAVKEQDVSFDSALTTEQSQITQEDSSLPELAGSYVLTKLPLAHCPDHTNPLDNYLEVICFFNRN